ncbi:MAG: Rrf2 family transcriptional regulator [Terracidiphilus sp.]|nr:Rrf2 family transcriptional regulator [Terracidiphilus sp.]
MQLTRASDYAVRVMIHLATLPEGERALLPTLALATGAPGSFLSKILQNLSRAGLIASYRGQLGGFEILPRGRQASVREVIEAIDGPISLNLCLQHGKSCSRKSWCPAHLVWVQAQAAMLQVLDQAIVADLAQQALPPAPDPAALAPLLCPSVD